MNILIASVVGGFASVVVTFVGVNAVQGPDDIAPVKNDQLYSYSDQ